MTRLTHTMSSLLSRADLDEHAAAAFCTGAAGSSAHEPAVFLERFRAARLLSRHEGRETWLGQDEATQQSVVIRVSPTAIHTDKLLKRLEKEIATLQQDKDLSARPEASVLAFGRGPNQVFAVRPFLQGTPLTARLRGGALNLADTFLVARAILESLRVAHERGIQHGAVRPGNVILGVAADPSRVALVNLGYYQNKVFDAAIYQQPLDTAIYLSLEQSGAVAREVGFTSDLYSAGIILFECLTGAPPFQSDDVGTVLLKHVTEPVPDLQTKRSDIPRPLNDLVQRMLRKDSHDRYQSAEAILADLRIIEDAWRGGNSDPDLVIGASDRRRTLTEPVFVGREDELRQLQSELHLLTAGRGSMAIVECESGGGKSRLLEKLTSRALREGIWVLHGQGVNEVGQRPFQVLEDVLRELSDAARANQSFADEISTRLGDARDAIHASLPDVAEAFGWEARASLGPERFGETRSIHAVTTLIEAIGSSQRPVMIILDDCQWADELALKLLVHWNRRWAHADPGRRYLSVVAAFRSEEAAGTDYLRQLHCRTHLRLAPFDAEHVRQLLESMSGPLPDDAIKAVCQLAEGSPFMATAVLRGMVESGALVADRDGWRVEPLAMADLRSSSRAGELLSRRIDLLPAPTLSLLSAGAVLGKEFALDMASVLSRLSAAEAAAALSDGRQRHLVWVRPDGSQCAFVHDRVRATLLDRLGEQERKALHLRAARHIRDQRPDDVYELAYHFHAAGAFDLAHDCALRAAERARAVHSLEIAEQFYRIAEKGVSSSDTTTCYQIAEGLGDVLMLRGQYDEAARLFGRAAMLAEGRYKRAQVQGKLGELAFKRGDMESAALSFETALRLLGRRVPRNIVIVAIWLIWETFVQLWHTLCPTLLLGRIKRPLSKDQQLSLRLFSRLAHAYWFARSKVPVFWIHLRGLNLAERHPPSLELGQACSEHAPGMTLVGLYQRGVAYAERSLAIRKELGDIWGQGQSLHFHGVVLYAASRYEQCIDKCREAVRLLERTGDFWEVHIARYQIAASLYRLGDLAGALEEARRIHASGLELGDEQASGISLDVWARSAPAQLPPPVLQQELSRKRHDAQGIGQVAIAEAVLRIHNERYEEAAAGLEKAIRTFSRAGVWNVYVSPNFTWLATALRRQCEWEGVYTPQRRHGMLRRALRAARRARRAAKRFQNDLPHALREHALVLAMLGKRRRARGEFLKSLRVARKQKA
ncbi:MAG: protein kinase, partial [Planctomycetes bacterium]|nr:protein kinase [Planctomycetota bacterium]